jgi:hypothetical protein
VHSSRLGIVPSLTMPLGPDVGTAMRRPLWPDDCFGAMSTDGPEASAWHAPCSMSAILCACGASHTCLGRETSCRAVDAEKRHPLHAWEATQGVRMVSGRTILLRGSGMLPLVSHRDTPPRTIAAACLPPWTPAHGSLSQGAGRKWIVMVTRRRGAVRVVLRPVSPRHL